MDFGNFGACDNLTLNVACFVHFILFEANLLILLHIIIS